MRILYVISGLGLGGAEKQVIELARQLSRCGHQIAIYTLTRDVSRAGDLVGSGVTVVVDAKRARLDWAVVWRLRGMLRSWRPDIVHGFLFDGNFYSRIAALGTGIPVLNSERSNGYSLSAVQQLAQRLTRSCASGIVANTYGGAAFAQRLFGLPAARVHVVWNGVRIEELEQRASTTVDYRVEFFGEPNVRMACLVGSIRPVKDYHLALESAARLIDHDSSWRVLLIGDRLATPAGYAGGAATDSSGYKAEVLAHYERTGLQDRIRFCGLRGDVPAILRQCDALYVTSLNEGFPNAVLEAMALGVPVVSTQYSDIRRILPRREQIVETRDPGEIARAILWTSSERETIARQQLEWVRAHATIERAARELEDLYSTYAGMRAPLERYSGAAAPPSAYVATARTEHER